MTRGGKRVGAGRKPLPEQERRSNRVVVHLTDAGGPRARAPGGRRIAGRGSARDRVARAEAPEDVAPKRSSARVGPCQGRSDTSAAGDSTVPKSRSARKAARARRPT